MVDNLSIIVYYLIRILYFLNTTFGSLKIIFLIIQSICLNTINKIWLSTLNARSHSSFPSIYLKNFLVGKELITNLDIKSEKINFQFFGIFKNFLFRKLWLFATTKRISTRVIKENNHILCVSKPLKFQ